MLPKSAKESDGAASQKRDKEVRRDSCRLI
jgi:hypothetical protein